MAKKDDTAMLVHLLEKVDRVEGHCQRIRESQIRTEKDVAEHIRRTNLLEEEIKTVKQKVLWLTVPIDICIAVLRFFRIIR